MNSLAGRPSSLTFSIKKACARTTWWPARLRFLTGRIGASFVGVACTIVALVLVLPIPFANLVPTLRLSAFSIGLTSKDGLFVLAGYGLIAVAGGVIVLGPRGLALGLSHLRKLL
jgi:hypothetical protein